MLEAEFSKYKDLWLQHRKGEEPIIPAIGSLKALRNFAKLLMLAKQHPTVGIDHRSKAAEYLGDMFMYIFGMHCALGEDFKYNGCCAGFDSVEAGLATCTYSFGRMMYVVNAGSSVGFFLKSNAQCVVSLCKCCCIEPEEACKISLEKLCSKWSATQDQVCI